MSLLETPPAGSGAPKIQRSPTNLYISGPSNSSPREGSPTRRGVTWFCGGAVVPVSIGSQPEAVSEKVSFVFRPIERSLSKK